MTETTTLALRQYQRTALEHLQVLYADEHARATLTLPCGLGKTVVAGHLIGNKHRLTVMFVPTVDLLKQTVSRLSEIATTAHYVSVCSPAAVAGEDDDVPAGVSQTQIANWTGSSATTDPDEVATIMSGPGQIVVVSTYASAPVIAEALEAARTSIDLLICDEAHRTAGFATKSWAQPLADTFTPARKRLFMTATTKVVTVAEEPTDATESAAVAVLSMESIADYGVQVSPISFRQGINEGWLSDYRIAVVGVGNAAVADLVDNYKPSGSAEMNLAYAATQLALLRYLKTHQLRSILVFHNSIADSKRWSTQMSDIADYHGIDLEVLHVDGTSGSDQRDYALAALETTDRITVVSNCKVFAEGVDVPGIDAILFAAPRTSSPDIVQIVGRAIRPHPRGRDRKALIIVPVLESVHDSSPIDVKASRTGFYAAWQVLTTLAEEDEYVNNALVQWRGLTAGDSAVPTDPAPEPIIDLDTDLLDAFTESDVFRFHIVHRTTSHHVLTATKLRAFYNRTGRSNPGPAYVGPDNYPLGKRVQATRQAKRAGVLPARVADLFTSLPGWQWNPGGASTRRTPDQWIDLVEQHILTTNIHVVHRWERTTDPATGSPVAIGEWLHKSGRLRSLTAAQRDRVHQLVSNLE